MQTQKQFEFQASLDQQPLEQFIQKFSPAMKQYVTLNQPLSGLSCFLRGYFEEQSKNFESSFKYYNEGVRIYLDASCAYRLSQIYSDPSNEFAQLKDERRSYFFQIISTKFELVYIDNFQSLMKIKKLIKENDPQLIITNQIIHEQSQEFLQIYEENLKSILNFQLERVNYKGLVQSFIDLIKSPNYYVQCYAIYRLIQLITYTINTNDKCIDQILLALKDTSLMPALMLVSQQINANIQIMCCFKEDNILFERTREYLFEMIYLIKNILSITSDSKKFVCDKDQISDFLKNSNICGQMWKNINNSTSSLMKIISLIGQSNHKVVLIRIISDSIAKGDPFTNKKANYEEGILIHKRELEVNQPSKFSFALCHYHIAKLSKKLNKLEDYKSHLNKAQQLLSQRLTSTIHDNVFSKIMSYYYLSRIANQVQNYLDEGLFLNETLSRLTINFPLKQVRTIQFHTILKKVQKRLPLVQKDLEDQKTFRQNEYTEQILLLNEQKTIVSSIIASSIKQTNSGRSNQSGSDQQNGPGPMIPKMIETNSDHPQTAIQEYANRTNFESCLKGVARKTLKFQEKSGLFFVKPEDIEMRQILQKGTCDGGSYKIILSGKQYGMKLIISIKKDIFQIILTVLKDLILFSHPCLRRSLAYLVEPVTSSCLNLGLIYEYNQHNLYQLEHLSITMTQKIQISMDIVGAVNCLHQQKYYHGNLKPSNILIHLVGGQFHGVVSDWEFCKNIYPLIYNETFSISGWSAPEVFLEKQKPNTYSDSWSIGMLLLFIIYTINASKLKDPYGFIKLPDQDKTLNDTLNSLLHKDPKQRMNLEDTLKALTKVYQSIPQ